jgi:NitT/TauT family transport system substrate-binding protein
MGAKVIGSFGGTAMWRRVALLATLTAMLFTLAACGDDSDSAEADGGGDTASTAPPAGADETTTTVAREPVNIDVGISGLVSLASGPVWYAIQEGPFESHGLVGNPTGIQGDPNAVAALISGEVDAIYVGTGAVISAIQGGADIRIIASVTPGVNYLLVANEGVEQMADIAGTRVGVSQPGAISYLVPRLAFQRAGVDPESAQYVAIGNDADRARAIIANQIDVTVLNVENGTATLEGNPGIHMLENLTQTLHDDFLLSVVAVSGRFADENPETVQAMVEALMEASRAYQSDPETVVPFASTEGELPEATISAALATLTGDGVYYGVDGGLNRDAFESTVELLVANGDLPAPVSFEEAVDTTFVDAAVDKLGAFDESGG